MGLLTDPNSERGKLTKLLIKFYNPLCILLYVVGVLWFCSLASREVSSSTYFSENALLPGLVRSEFRDDTPARKMHYEIVEEMKKYDNSIPYPWILAKFRQLGLDTFTHNFTLHYPLKKSQIFHGKNVYGIVRSPRGARTESLVLSVPYRPPNSPHPTTSPSLAILMAFAQFAANKNYWAKDIIFLITEHEQLGMQAWLDAYHGVESSEENVLKSGDLEGRAGAIQAAINLELHSVNTAKVDIKIEGLNGQLPNLDLFNLVTKICSKEGIYTTFKLREAKNFRDPITDWKYSMKTLLAMVTSQATGVPNGNHGLFHRYGIDALTIEGFETADKQSNKWRADFLTIGRVLEGTFRSLNNLLEKFHQSFFFYLLPASNRYVSIGVYFPCLAAIAGALFIRAMAKWCLLQKQKEEKDESEEETEVSKLPEENIIDKARNEVFKVYMDKNKLKEMRDKFEKAMKEASLIELGENDSHIGDVLSIFLLVHIIGIVLMKLPNLLAEIGYFLDYNYYTSIFFGYVIFCCGTLFFPFFISFTSYKKPVSILNILALLEMGTLFVCIGMNNFSLAILTSILYVPFALSMTPIQNRCVSVLQKIFWIFLHPLFVFTAIVTIYAHVQIGGDTLKETLGRGLISTQQGLVYAIIDSMIYGNWLFNIIFAIFIPNWLCFWIVSFAKIKETKAEEHEKMD